MSATTRALLAAAALAAGCADGQSFLHVTVTGDVAGIDHLDVRVVNAGQTATATFRPAAVPFALPFDFALTFDASRRGAVGLHVDARSPSALLGSGDTTATIQPSHGTTVSLALAGEPPDLGSGADLATPADLAVVDLLPTSHDLAVTPLFGDATVEASTDTHAAGLADASNFVAAMSGTVNSVSVFYDSGDATELLIGLYDDASNHPHNLLAQGMVANPTVAAWNTATVAPTAVVMGNTYWIALVTPVGHGTTFSFRYGTGGGGNTTTEHSTESNLTTLPATWTTGQTFPGTFCSFYASP